MSSRHYKGFFLIFISSFSFANEIRNIPVEYFSTISDVTPVVLSPNGAHIASLVKIDKADFKGHAVEILNIDSSESKLHAATDNKKVLYNAVSWLNDQTLLIDAKVPVERYKTFAHNTRLMKMDIESGALEPLISDFFYRKFESVSFFQGRIIDYLRNDSDHVLISFKSNLADSDEVYKISLSDGDPVLVQKARKGYYRWFVDQQHRVRLARNTWRGTKTEIMLKDLKTNEFRELWDYEYYSDKRIIPLV